MKLVLHGCNGKMGRVLTKQISEKEELEIVAGFDHSEEKFQNQYPVYQNPFQFSGQADVVIDFSHPSLIETLLSFCLERQMPLVCATTGLSTEQMELLQQAAKEIPVLYSANMSLGVNLLVHLVQQAVSVVADSFDIEIIEKHHNKKLDAPSGTAYLLADAMNDGLGERKEYILGRAGMDTKRRSNEIGIHSLRGGTIAGEHSVIFAGDDEVIELKHTALSKRIFAVGALRGAEWIVGQNSEFYTMNDVLHFDDMNQLLKKTLTV